MSRDPIVRVRGLHTVLGGKPVLKGIDLEVLRGEVVVLIGPSGSGKSTLLRSLNYLTPFTRGEIEIAGLSLQPRMSERLDAEALRAVRLRAGMIFQNFHLFPHLTVLGNIIEAPVRVLALERAQAEQRARTLLQRVGLGDFEAAYPHTLSGGQQQRVAIARALAMEPAILLCDEPTSALDPTLVGEVLNVISDLAAGGQTMVIVTHEMEFARRVAHRVVELRDGQICR